MYSLLQNLLAPTTLRDKTLDENALMKHYEPKTQVIAECFQFYRRNQVVGKLVVQYVAELRRSTKHGEFGTYLDDALRDCFVCSLWSEMI